MIKTRWTAFRTSPGRTCGHLHKTKASAEKCLAEQRKQYGGTWHVSSAQYSH